MTAEIDADANVPVMAADVGLLKPEVGDTLPVLATWYTPELVARASSEEVTEPLARPEHLPVGVGWV